MEANHKARIEAAAADLNMSFERAEAYIAELDALCDESDAAIAARNVVAETTREELAGCLRQCAMHCTDRATDKQISYIVSLIFKAGRQNEVWGGMKLTSRAASNLIDSLKA